MVGRRDSKGQLSGSCEDSESVSPNWMEIALVCASLAGVLLLVRLSRRQRRRWQRIDTPANFSIDIAALPVVSPTERGVRLEVYGVPVVVSVLVIAPVGRSVTLPEKARMSRFMENLVPGMMEVLSSHHPLFRRWPEQLSTQGFVHAVFNNLALPGERGKGTPWCSVAGRFESEGYQYLAALVCRSEVPNGLGQIEIQHAGQWHDILRVRRTDRDG